MQADDVANSRASTAVSLTVMDSMVWLNQPNSLGLCWHK
jgi:hypothetical protein